VFGDYWTDLALDYPSSRTGGSESLTAWLASSLKDSDVKPGKGPLDGLMQRAYSEPAGHPLQDKLRRELRRLQASR
jgi:hypothetical protein